MGTTYTTAQGDAWDLIAHAVYGDTAYTHLLMQANITYIDTMLFRAGVTLCVPDLPETVQSTLPDWRTA